MGKEGETHDSLHPDSSEHTRVTTSQPRPPAYKWLVIAPKWLYANTIYASTDETVQRVSSAVVIGYSPRLALTDVANYTADTEVTHSWKRPIYTP
eukprot:2647320-Heterocapsa_arctica.AAC.1